MILKPVVGLQGLVGELALDGIPELARKLGEEAQPASGAWGPRASKHVYIYIYSLRKIFGSGICMYIYIFIKEYICV